MGERWDSPLSDPIGDFRRLGNTTTGTSTADSAWLPAFQEAFDQIQTLRGKPGRSGYPAGSKLARKAREGRIAICHK